MIKDEIKLRVRYSETDQMGFVYYGNYAQYLEIARVAVLKKVGISYKEMEEKGFLLPVSSYSINYYKAAKYDEELTIVVTISDMPTNRIKFDYVVKRDNVVLANAITTLIFMNKEGKACRPPNDFLTQLEPYFN